MTSSLISSRAAPAKATELHAKASADFAAKLTETEALLQRAANDFQPLTQASSLGAEDVVITHIINRLRLDIPVFVLETGALHTETLALLERTQAHSRAPVTVYRPVQESVIRFVRERGQDAIYQSIELRKECCGTDFRDFRAKELGAELIVRNVEDSMKRGTVRLAHPGESRNVHQSVTLLEAIEEFRFDALIGGARRDEEKARAKERIFSHRDSFGQWQPKAQRPELWTLFNTRLQPGEHFRVFPISNWTELDVWQYITRENIALPSIYYTHKREVVDRRGLLVPVTELTPPKDGEQVEIRDVRFRTVGDITCTCPVESDAATPEQIVIETLVAEVSERGATRMDDKTSDASMEKRKKDGYF